MFLKTWLFSGMFFFLFWFLGSYCITIKPKKCILFPKGHSTSKS